MPPDPPSGCPDVPQVKIAYRRTLAEMPADREELEAALADGAELHELSLPVRLEPGRITAEVMQLGEPDASGRRAPVPTGRSESFACDLLVSAVGESPDPALFERFGVPLDGSGRPVIDPDTLETPVPSVYAAGDAARGPASIIRAAADGRIAAAAILRSAGVSLRAAGVRPSAAGVLAAPPPDPDQLARRGRMIPSLPLADVRSAPAEWIEREAERCLSCDSACLRCVEVCPNRANIAVPVPAGGSAEGAFSQGLQILHVDSLCNECGNCGFFCPYEGEPFRGKPTLFESGEALAVSENDGFAFVPGESGIDVLLRTGGTILRVPTAGFPDRSDHPAAGVPWEPDPMVRLARTVFAEHRYLIPGGTP